ncbi:hypothetical protein RCCS2_14919 [Roseobacter sp. CCS2]|nr:hypothetical protein RCCS2_14919 [Roseobacter sp. CCS2]
MDDTCKANIANQLQKMLLALVPTVNLCPMYDGIIF